MKRPIFSALVACLFGVLAACGGSNPPLESADSQDREPVPQTQETTMPPKPIGIDQPTELTVYFLISKNGSEEAFMNDFGSFIQKKYPKVTFRFIPNATGSSLSDLVATKTKLDLIVASQSQIYELGELGLLTDISDYIKTYQFDLSRLETSSVENLRKITNGKVVGLPFRINTLAMFYNKDLFDKFAQPYIQDGSTWDEVYEIAKRLTTVDDGVQYWGLSLAQYGNFVSLNQYAHELVDPVTLVPTYNGNFWKPYLENFLRFAQLPSRGLTREILLAQDNLFMKQKTLAMMVGTIGSIPALARESSHLNWDIASYPVFKELPDIGPPPAPSYLLLSANSTHKKEAFLAMAEMLSDETQLELSRRGNPTALTSPAIRNAFGAGLTELKDKNIQKLLPDQMALPITWNKYTIESRGPITNAFLDVALGAKDINTALREAQERAEKIIADMK